MSVESSPFRGVRLTGKDATAFRDQVKSDRATNKVASEALAEGRVLLNDLDNNGYVTIKTSK